MEEEDDYSDARERIFHNTVREYVIYLIIFIILFVCSGSLISKFRQKDKEDYFSIDEDDAIVYKTSMYLCVFALSVTICAALLLPCSIISNEVLLLYPKSFYVKWLNHSLIQGIWNLVFLFSNLSLFGLLPFAYLFTESEGFYGSRKGVRSRVYETMIVVVLLFFIMFGLCYVISALLDPADTSLFAFNNFSVYYLPFLYSCISFLGVILQLIFTPLGFTSLFSLVSHSLVKPQFLSNVNDEFDRIVMEEEVIYRRIRSANGVNTSEPPPLSDMTSGLKNGTLQSSLIEKLLQIKHKRTQLEKQKSTSAFQRNIVYPVAMLSLLVLTALTVLLVLVNSLMLLIGIKALPKSTAQFTLGLESLSKIGSIGAAIEIFVILYLAVTSCVGLYSLPFFNRFRPHKQKTPLSLLIGNCAILLILSSALPLLARILGITNFDLLGNYGKVEWLGNFKIVFTYNLLFAAVTTLCLFKKLTAPVCKELLLRIKKTLSIFQNKEGNLRFCNIFTKDRHIKED